MDRSTLEQRLLEVNEDLAAGAENLQRHRQAVADLMRSGQDTEAARKVLRDVEATQAMYAVEADRLANELAALPAENAI